MKGTNMVSNAEATPARIAARKVFNEQSHTMLKKPRNTRLSPTDRQEIAAAYADGADPRVLAVKYGISAGYVRSLSSR